MDYKTIKSLPLEFRVWDIPNQMFLMEFQTPHGQWVWGRREDLAGQSSFKWILDHPDDFVVSQYVGIDDTVNKKKIFTYDIITCWDHAADEGVRHCHTGVIEFANTQFYLNCDGVQMGHWTSAENKEVKGNIFQHKNIMNQ